MLVQGLIVRALGRTSDPLRTVFSPFPRIIGTTSAGSSCFGVSVADATLTAGRVLLVLVRFTVSQLWKSQSFAAFSISALTPAHYVCTFASWCLKLRAAPLPGFAKLKMCLARFPGGHLNCTPGQCWDQRVISVCFPLLGSLILLSQARCFP